MTDDDPRVQAATRAWNRTARQSGRASLTNPTAIAAVLAAADAVDPLRQAPTVPDDEDTEQPCAAGEWCGRNPEATLKPPCCAAPTRTPGTTEVDDDLLRVSPARWAVAMLDLETHRHGLAGATWVRYDDVVRLAHRLYATGPCDESTVERACEVMHDAYEAAAVGAGWETQQDSRKPWADVPEANKATMRAAVTALLEFLRRLPEPPA